jgi:ribonuclease R
MSQRQCEVFEARISGVTRFGLFVTVGTNGARGLIPLASLPDDRWIEDKARHGLSGQRTGLRFALGEAVEVRLVAAEPRTGRMTFHLMQGLPVAAHRRAGRTRGGRPAS